MWPPSIPKLTSFLEPSVLGREFLPPIVPAHTWDHWAGWGSDCWVSDWPDWHQTLTAGVWGGSVARPVQTTFGRRAYSACPSILNPCPSALWCLLTCSRCPVKVAQSCPSLCDPMNCTVHGILQARIPEWVAFPLSRGSSQPRDQTQVSHIAGGFFTSWATREALGAQSLSFSWVHTIMLPSDDVYVSVCYSLVWAARLQTHWEQGCDHFVCSSPALIQLSAPGRHSGGPSPVCRWWPGLRNGWVLTSRVTLWSALTSLSLSFHIWKLGLWKHLFYRTVKISSWLIPDCRPPAEWWVFNYHGSKEQAFTSFFLWQWALQAPLCLPSYFYFLGQLLLPFPT